MIRTKQRLQQPGGGTTELVTQYAYDRLGRLVSTTDPRNAVTQFQYDKAGNRTRIVDPVNNATTYTYDRLNRLTQEQNALGLSRTYQLRRPGAGHDDHQYPRRHGRAGPGDVQPAI